MTMNFRFRATPALLLLGLGSGVAACSNDAVRTPVAGDCAGLVAGDLVISEIMVDPPGADDGNEWFEIYNATGDAVDLAGVVLRYSKVDDSGEKFHTLNAGGLPGAEGETGGETGGGGGGSLMLGSGEYMVIGDAEPVALAAFVNYGHGGELGSMGQAAGKLGLGCGGNEIDTVIYEDPADGASYTFDGSRAPDAAGNDDLEAWCDAVTPLGDEAFGTPGAANDLCFGSAPTTCMDASGMRDVVPPGEGDLVISEFMPDPMAVGDGDGEWFELTVNRAVDLNGLGLGKIGEEADDVLGDSVCLSVDPGDRLVFAKSDDSMVNGGLPTVDFTITFSMSNSGSNLSVTWGDTVVDNVMWASSSSGRSSSLNPDTIDAVANDDPANYCPSETPYGLGDFGTPGEANDVCPIEPVPGQCMGDGGLRDIVRPSPGDLLITEFMPNPSAVGDGDGEWFEVHALADFDLNELQLGRDGEVDELLEIPECVSVSSGDFVLFAKSAEPDVNGGLSDVDVVFGLSLVNSNGSLFIASEGTTLDEITWAGSSDGAATSLDPSFVDPADNDSADNFCDATELYGAGDLGTPGEENPSCGGSPPGTCLEGETARDIVFAAEGDLVITEWMADPSAVGDSEGEWFEVLVNRNIDLNGLQFGDDPKSPDAEVPNSGECVSVSAGDRVVFGHEMDPLLNGGIDNVTVLFTFGLTNGGDTLFVGAQDTVIDTVTFGSATAGSSTSVSPGSEDAVANDDELNHCTSNTPYGDGDNGTPGAPNACE